MTSSDNDDGCLASFGYLVVGGAAFFGLLALVVSCSKPNEDTYYERSSSHKVEEITPWHNVYNGYSTFFTDSREEVVRRDYLENNDYYNNFVPSLELRAQIVKRHGKDFLAGYDRDGLRVVRDFPEGSVGRTNIEEFGFSGDEVRRHVTIHLAKDKKIVGEGR